MKTWLYHLAASFTLGATVPPSDNEFLPDERGIAECISALQKPGCGSEARGGWLQFAVFAFIIVAFVFIAWRVWRASTRARSLRGE